MADLRVNLLGQNLDNPIIPASGTFGFGYEYSDYFDINILGSIALKGTTLKEKYGNPLPRIAECPAGMINAIGLQNPGADSVIDTELKKLYSVYKKPIIPNIGGETIEEYLLATEKFNRADNILALELNISCPNVKGGGMAFGVDSEVAKNLVKEVKAISRHPIMVKLSPNVTDIVKMARAVEEGGGDAISLINTLVGMRLDLKTGKPIISVKMGGYSGKGVFPVALRMVYQVAQSVGVPVVGMGGISSAYDVIEMMYAGASAVMVGTENLINPFASKQIIESLPSVMAELKIDKLKNIIGRSFNG